MVLLALEKLPPLMMNYRICSRFHHILVSNQLNTFPDLRSHAHISLDRWNDTPLPSPRSSSQLASNLLSRHWFSVCQIWDSQLCVAGGKLWMDVWKFNDATLSGFFGLQSGMDWNIKTRPETAGQRKRNGRRGLVWSWKIYGCNCFCSIGRLVVLEAEHLCFL